MWYMQKIQCKIFRQVAEVSGDIWIGQPAYIDKVTEKFGMKDAKCADTPS